MKLTISVLRKCVTDHSAAIIVGVLIAVLVVSPHIRALQIVGLKNFEGVYPTFNDDEVAYQARIKEVVEGNFGLGNPYIKEHMNDSFIMPPVAEWVIAGIVRLTHTSVPFITSVSDAVLTFLNFLLVYTLFFIIVGKRKGLALLYTSIFFIFSLSVFGRPISPQLNAVPLFIGLIYIAKLHFSENVCRKKLNLVAGFFTGITVFFYPYFFTTMLAVYGSLIVVRSCFEQTLDPIKKNVVWFLISFLPFAFAFVFFQFRASGLDFYGETILRYGLLHTHIPGSFTNVALGILTLGVVVVAYKLLSKTEFIFGVSSALSIVALNWQNIITGQSLQFSSHYLFTTVLFVLLVLSSISAALIRTEKGLVSYWVRIGSIMGVVLLLLILAENRKEEFIHIGVMPYTENALLVEQEKMKVFDWFNEHTPANSVVYTLGDTYDFLLPIYTENKVFYNFYAALYPAANNETEDRWLISQLFNEDMSTTTIREKQRDFWGNRFIDTYQSKESRKKILATLTGVPYISGAMIEDSYIDAMYKKWTTIREEPLEKVLSRYEIEYILVSPKYPYYTETKNRLNKMKNISLTVTINGVSIYTFD